MTKAKEFDSERFRKLAAHGNNRDPNEWSNAMRQLVKLGDDSGLTFPEACTRAFGGGDFERIDQLEQELARKAEEIAERDRENAELIETYEAKLQASKKRVPKQHRSVWEFLCDTGTFAQCRIAIVLTLIAAFLYVPFPHVSHYALWAFWLFIGYLGVSWCSAEVDESGYGGLLMKAALVAAGLSMLHDHRESALVIIGLLVVTVVTRLVNNLADLAMKQSMIAKVIGLFV